MNKLAPLRLLGLMLFGLCLSALALPIQAQDPNACDESGEFPDVIVGDLHQKRRWGAIDGKTAFSIGTTSCNIGTCWLEWIDDTNRHPVIGQSMYRLHNGRFEQIGQSWLKHGFFALSGGLCDSGCLSTDGTHLGVNCSDPYSAGLNGSQSGLGPKYEVNAATGAYNYPFTTIGQSGNALYKRLIVDNSDMDPATYAGAQFFAEGHYISPDDAEAGRDNNNASYRPINIIESAGFYDLSLTGSTVRELPAIFAWAAADPTVQIMTVDVPGDGRVFIAAKVSDNGDGTWHYEYAVHNLNSHRSVGAFFVPLPTGVTLQNVGFHDVDYHSGEVQVGTDWSWTHNTGNDPNFVFWATEPQAVNPNANAIRWGTLYNFRFDVAAPPAEAQVFFETWLQPGNYFGTMMIAPDLCNQNGTCDPGEDCQNCPNDCGSGSGQACCGDNVCELGEDRCSCAADCGEPEAFESNCGDGVDDDCDGQVDCADGECCGVGGCGNGPDNDSDTFPACIDCDDTQGAVWSTPGAAIELEIDAGAQAELSWSAPATMGGLSVDYRVLRSGTMTDFVNGVACLSTAGESTNDADLPAPDAFYGYLVQAVNSCPQGHGPTGDATSGPRSVLECP